MLRRQRRAPDTIVAKALFSDQATRPPIPGCIEFRAVRDDSQHLDSTEVAQSRLTLSSPEAMAEFHRNDAASILQVKELRGYLLVDERQCKLHVSSVENFEEDNSKGDIRARELKFGIGASTGYTCVDLPRHHQKAQKVRLAFVATRSSSANTITSSSMMGPDACH